MSDQGNSRRGAAVTLSTAQLATPAGGKLQAVSMIDPQRPPSAPAETGIRRRVWWRGDYMLANWIWAVLALVLIVLLLWWLL
jgi:hypothetical protein